MKSLQGVRLDPGMVARIEAAARRNKRTRSDMIRVLLDEALAAIEAPEAGQAREMRQALEEAKA